LCLTGRARGYLPTAAAEEGRKEERANERHRSSRDTAAAEHGGRSKERMKLSVCGKGKEEEEEEEEEEEQSCLGDRQISSLGTFFINYMCYNTLWVGMGVEKCLFWPSGKHGKKKKKK
jgi:hypothetical protein